MYDRSRLMLGILHRHEMQVWPTGRLHDGLGIRRVILLPLDERLHIDRRNQPHLVPGARGNTAPVWKPYLWKPTMPR